MAEFKVIETQEQLDAIIGERLTRERTKMEEKFRAYISPDELNSKIQGLNDQIADLSTQLTSADGKYKELEKTIGEKDAAIKKYETASVKNRIAHEIGLPYELVGRISGETEEDIRADAEALNKIFKVQNVPPLRNPDEPPTDSKNAAYKSLLNNLIPKEN